MVELCATLQLFSKGSCLAPVGVFEGKTVVILQFPVVPYFLAR
jgi:hypothetical protein